MYVEGSLITIMVSDLQRALAFYTETLGLVQSTVNQGSFVAVQAPGLLIGLSSGSAHPPDWKPGQPAGTTAGLHVVDFKAAVQRLRNEGITVTIQDIPSVQMATFQDPDQNQLYIFSYPP